MTLIACCSIKGAPGVTTAALALAACWPGEAAPVLAEADPSGGDLQILFGLPPDTPGMVTLAASRGPGAPGLLWRHTHRLPGGLAVVAGPPGAGQARATAARLAASSYAPLTAAAHAGAVIIADCGRADPATPATPLLAAADLLLAVTGASAAALAHLDTWLPALRPVNPRLRLLMTGPRGPYPAAEISRALHAEIAGRLPHDPAAAAMLRGAPVRRGWRTRWRSPQALPLVAAAAATARHLQQALRARPAPPHGTATGQRPAGEVPHEPGRVPPRREPGLTRPAPQGTP